jgi:hypothetical protein
MQVAERNEKTAADTHEMTGEGLYIEIYYCIHVYELTRG